MANYRDGLDALNALVDEQRRTNELLEQLVKKQPEITKTPAGTPENKPAQRRGRQKK